MGIGGDLKAQAEEVTMTEKRIFGVYDPKGQLRYIGATVLGDSEKVASNMVAHYNTAKAEIDKGKRPNKREILVKNLIKIDFWDVRFLTNPRADWEKQKQQAIALAKKKGIRLANESDGGRGASGNKLSPSSMQKRNATRERMDNEIAFRMHCLYRNEGWKQKAIAEKYGMSEKGVQKILSGERRAEALKRWEMRFGFLPTIDPDEDVPW